MARRVSAQILRLCALHPKEVKIKMVNYSDDEIKGTLENFEKENNIEIGQQNILNTSK